MKKKIKIVRHEYIWNKEIRELILECETGPPK